MLLASFWPLFKSFVTEMHDNSRCSNVSAPFEVFTNIFDFVVTCLILLLLQVTKLHWNAVWCSIIHFCFVTTAEDRSQTMHNLRACAYRFDVFLAFCIVSSALPVFVHSNFLWFCFTHLSTCVTNHRKVHKNVARKKNASKKNKMCLCFVPFSSTCLAGNGHFDNLFWHPFLSDLIRRFNRPVLPRLLWETISLVWTWLTGSNATSFCPENWNTKYGLLIFAEWFEPV